MSPTFVPRSPDASKVVEAMLSLAEATACYVCPEPLELVDTHLIDTFSSGTQLAHYSCKDIHQKRMSNFLDRMEEIKEELEE